MSGSRSSRGSPVLDPPVLGPAPARSRESAAAERAAERAATGFCLVGHPVAHAARRAAAAGAASLDDALRADSRERVVVAATVRALSEKRTRRGEWSATLWLEDARTRCEASCFPRQWAAAAQAVLDGDGQKPDLDRVLLLSCARDREPGRLVVESATTLDPAVLEAAPATLRAARLRELRDRLGDFCVVDTETCLGPPDGLAGQVLAAGSLGAAAACAALGAPGKAPGSPSRARGRASAGAGPGAVPGGPGGPAGADERGDWLARQRVVELGVAFFKRARGRAPLRGEAVGSDGLVPQWVEFKRVSRLLDPGCPIDEDTRRVHGISDAQVAGQPGFAARAADLARVLGGWPCVATYSGGRFDVPVLLREFARAGVAAPRTLASAHLDLAELVARRYPGRTTRPASNKLGDQCAFWGVPLVGAHRADADAAAAGHLLLKLLQNG